MLTGALRPGVALAGDGAPAPLVTSALLPLLDGTHRLEEVYGLLIASGVAVVDIVAAMRWLDDQGLLQEAGDAGGRTFTEAEDHRYRAQRVTLATLTGGAAGMSADDPRLGHDEQARLKGATVTLFGLGKCGASVVRSLVMAGVGRIVAAPCDASEMDDPPARGLVDRCRELNPFVRFDLVAQPDEIPASLGDVAPDLLVYFADGFDDVFCDWINRISLQIRVPLLVGRQKALEVEIGPLVLPGETACCTCYRLRRRAALAIPADLDAEQGRSQGVAFPLGADLVALEAVRFLIGAEPATRGRMLHLDVATGRMGTHSVLRLPRCPSCGVVRSRPSRKLWDER